MEDILKRLFDGDFNPQDDIHNELKDPQQTPLREDYEVEMGYFEKTLSTDALERLHDFIDLIHTMNYMRNSYFFNHGFRSAVLIFVSIFSANIKT